jgi:hypothetical protein
MLRELGNGVGHGGVGAQRWLGIWAKDSEWRSACAYYLYCNRREKPGRILQNSFRGLREICAVSRYSLFSR